MKWKGLAREREAGRGLLGSWGRPCEKASINEAFLSCVRYGKEKFNILDPGSSQQTGLWALPSHQKGVTLPTGRATLGMMALGQRVVGEGASPPETSVVLLQALGVGKHKNIYVQPMQFSSDRTSWYIVLFLFLHGNVFYIGISKYFLELSRKRREKERKKSG